MTQRILLRYAPFIGTTRVRREAAAGGVVAAAVTVAYVVVARSFDTATSPVEIAALWSSLACVWLARTENIWTMPYGIVSVLLLGWYLLDVGLVGQGWLQFVFYVPVQVYGWWTWARGGPGRTGRSVTRLTLPGWAATMASLLSTWAILFLLFGVLYDEPAYLAWDTSIVAASVVAQTLMTFKHRESWWFWTIPVNVSAIGLFSVTRSWAFVFLYSVFLANSILGWRDWNRAESRR